MKPTEDVAGGGTQHANDGNGNGRRQRRRPLRESEIRFGALVAEVSPDGILAVDAKRRVLFVNSRFTELWGISPGTVASGDDASILSEVLDRVIDPAGFLARVNHLYEHPEEISRDEIALLGDKTIDRYSAPLTAPGGEYLGRVWFFRDISERKAAERAMERLDRVRAVLYETRSMILRAESRAELYREACRIAVEQGRLRLAWIGVLDEADELQTAAIHGAAHEYVSSLHVTLRDDRLHGRGPGARALRDRRAYVCNDIALDPDMPEREHALALGLRSMLVQPLIIEGRTLGAILMYSGETGFFDDEEVKLLESLAADIAHGIEFIVHREQLEYLAHYDPLTGLANRVRFSKRIQELIFTSRSNNRGLATIIVDLERFRSVSSTFGTAAGDHVLREVTARLLSVAGSSSCVARIGGDVFGIAAPDIQTVADCTRLRDALRARLSEPIALGKELLRLSAKIGIALFPGDGDSAESLFRNAEAALKAAKASGQGLLFYSHDMSRGIKHKLSLESQLRDAVEREQFVLHYQPKLEIRSGAITGGEALIRWQSPEQGLVAAGRFVPLLEETGLIVDVGRWALQRAMSDQRQWQLEGLGVPRIAVNLSALQLHQPDFLDLLKSVVGRSSGIGPSLDIEVTESMLMDDVEANIRKLKAVQDMGISIAVDDFGVGYSSLAYLARLPIDAVKIDRSFVVKMVDSADALDIVSAIISLGRSIGLKVIAEGVDSDEQLKLLRLLRCNEAQGFLFSPGVPAEKFAELLRGSRGFS
ncbi:MAG: EAL domain-containing protein [Nevskia sp.]|nr:EAL domain-containing protein [Nevskia sp.]